MLVLGGQAKQNNADQVVGINTWRILLEKRQCKLSDVTIKDVQGDEWGGDTADVLGLLSTIKSPFKMTYDGCNDVNLRQIPDACKIKQLGFTNCTFNGEFSTLPECVEEVTFLKCGMYNGLQIPIGTLLRQNTVKNITLINTPVCIAPGEGGLRSSPHKLHTMKLGGLSVTCMAAILKETTALEVLSIALNQEHDPANVELLFRESITNLRDLKEFRLGYPQVEPDRIKPMAIYTRDNVSLHKLYVPVHFCGSVHTNSNCTVYVGGEAMTKTVDGTVTRGQKRGPDALANGISDLEFLKRLRSKRPKKA